VSAPNFRRVVMAYHAHEPHCREQMRWLMSKETFEDFGRQVGVDPQDSPLPLDYDPTGHRPNWTIFGLPVDIIEGFDGVALAHMAVPAAWESGGDGQSPSA
jgi:hypothetical protein